MEKKKELLPQQIKFLETGKKNQFKRGSFQQKELARKAGVKSGEVRRQRKSFREAIIHLLSIGTTQNDIIAAVIDKALQGDVKAFESIRDTIGENPTSKIMQNTNITKAVVVFDDAKKNNIVDISPQMSVESDIDKNCISIPKNANTTLESHLKEDKKHSLDIYDQSNNPPRLAYHMGGGLYTSTLEKNTKNILEKKTQNNLESTEESKEDISSSSINEDREQECNKLGKEL